MKYKTHADNDSMYNTPNCWAIYCCGKVFKYCLLYTSGQFLSLSKKTFLTS